MRLLFLIDIVLSRPVCPKRGMWREVQLEKI